MYVCDLWRKTPHIKGQNYHKHAYKLNSIGLSTKPWDSWMYIVYTSPVTQNHLDAHLREHTAFCNVFACGLAIQWLWGTKLKTFDKWD